MGWRGNNHPASDPQPSFDWLVDFIIQIRDNCNGQDVSSLKVPQRRSYSTPPGAVWGDPRVDQEAEGVRGKTWIKGFFWGGKQGKAEGADIELASLMHFDRLLDTEAIASGLIAGPGVISAGGLWSRAWDLDTGGSWALEQWLPVKSTMQQNPF